LAVTEKKRLGQQRFVPLVAIREPVGRMNMSASQAMIRRAITLALASALLLATVSVVLSFSESLVPKPAAGAVAMLLARTVYAHSATS
jgi:hypothetical protein